MAEFVQQSIEEMLPELEQMERVDLFSSNECRAILKKRKAFEYKLRRKTKEKEDYLQYAQYEMNLLSLIKKRREKTGYTFKKLDIDVAVVQRIHKLFKDDVKLWLSHIEFCKMREEKASVGRLFTRMLQIHNKRPELWVLAAKWEMEDNASMENARGLLQRALRFNPDSKLLWKEYFRMELLNSDKLHKRLEILGLAKMDLDDDEMSQAVLGGQVALIVYHKALEAFPDDVEFHLSLLAICKLFQFAEDLTEAIGRDLQEKHGTNEMVLNLNGLEKLHKADLTWKDKSLKKKLRLMEVERLENEAWSDYARAVDAIPTVRMWTLYLESILVRLDGPVAKKLHSVRLEKALATFQTVCERRGLSEQTALQWVKVTQRSGDIEELVTLSEKLVQRFPSSVALWEARLHALAVTDVSVDTIQSTLELALKEVERKESLPLWQLVIEWCLINEPNSVEKLFERAVLEPSDVSLPMKVAYMEWSSHSCHIKQVRKLYKRLSSNQPLSVDFFRNYITIETEQLVPSIDRLRNAYEDALREYGSTDTHLWLDLARLEMSHPDGNPLTAAKVHFRARKALDESLLERFTTQFTLLQTGHISSSA